MRFVGRIGINTCYHLNGNKKLMKASTANPKIVFDCDTNNIFFSSKSASNTLIILSTDRNLKIVYKALSYIYLDRYWNDWILNICWKIDSVTTVYIPYTRFPKILDWIPEVINQSWNYFIKRDFTFWHWKSIKVLKTLRKLVSIAVLWCDA